MPSLLHIALGGAIGAMLRFVLVAQATRLFGPAFPWGTLLVNVTGSFAIGVALVFVQLRADFGWQRAGQFLMPGLLGGYTTFSAFSLDAFHLLERGRLVAAGAYVGGSVTLGLVAVTAGIFAARAWFAA